ncbi:hypothetical protein [Planotetraspora mira]|uniref:hypothetical protein n=1 Tax=Planotetraspora mira TaxID=58121 RepID=UPI001EF3613D|nr:hypothetical protein [Planotetraspora mira]
MSLQSVMPAAVSAVATVLAEQDGPVAQGPEADLRQVWAQITDPRDRRGGVIRWW